MLLIYIKAHRQLMDINETCIACMGEKVRALLYSPKRFLLLVSMKSYTMMNNYHTKRVINHMHYA